MTRAPIEHGQESDDSVRQMAAEWFVRVRAGLAEVDTAMFAAWLSEHPAHQTAYQDVAAAWGTVGELGSAPELITLRRHALANASRAARSRSRGKTSIGRLIAALAAAAVLLSLESGTIYVFGTRQSGHVFETAAGERRVVTLTDGSRISLDEGTRVSVAYSRRLRDLRLTRGQAEFEVANDAARPFSVTAAGRRVIATGTVFNVDLLAARLIVTLVEGHVLVAEDAGPPSAAVKTVELNASERLVVDTSNGSVQKAHVALDDVQAWKVGKLVFEGEPLDQAIGRVNRYARRKVSLADASAGGAPISGVFNAGDSVAFVEGVTAQLPLRAQIQADGEVLLARR